MDIEKTPIPGCMILSPFNHKDNRGEFTKTLSTDFYKKHHLTSLFVEEYYSKSKRDVLRGMHFQLPPHDHVKLVYCVTGRVMDVVIDLRAGSPTYLKSHSMTLDDDNKSILYIPKGLAHRFYTLSSSAIMIYKTTTEYSPDNDAGILWSTIPEIEWPSNTPILSERDADHQSLEYFDTPFQYRNNLE